MTKVNCKYADLELLFHICEGPKVLSLVEHPYNSWIATGHENGNVYLWDYVQNSLVLSINLTDKEETPSSKGGNVKSFLRTETKTGDIIQVQFYDIDVQKFNFQIAKNAELDTNQNFNAVLPNFYACNWIIILTEYRIVFFNYISKLQKELKIASLDGKYQTCCIPVGCGTLIAFGGVDGVVRVFDIDKWEVIHRLSSGNKAIKSLFSFRGVRGESIIISSGTDGSLFWWKDFLEPAFARKSIQGEMVDLIYNPLSGQIVTATSDRTFTWWKVQTSDVDARTKPSNSKVSFSILSSFHQHRFGTNSLLISSPAESKIYLMTLEGFTMDFFDTNDFPNSLKKSKVSNLKVHCQFPNTIMVCTKAGSISVLKMTTQPPTFALGRAKKKIFYPDSGIKIVGISLKRKGKPSFQKLTNNQGPITFGASSSGRYISVLWAESGLYQIWEIPKEKSDGWSMKEEGKAIDIVWSTGPFVDRFAILCPISPENTPELKKKKTILTSKKKLNPTPDRQQSLGNNVVVKSISDTGIKEIENNYSQKINILRLHGGLILGLSYEGANNILIAKKEKEVIKKGGSVRIKPNYNNKSVIQTTDTKIPSSRSGALDDWKADEFEKWVQFASWDGKVQFDAYPDVRFIVWDNAEEFCVLVYPTHFSIFEVRPKFKHLSTIYNTISTAVWGSGFLVFATQTQIECVFPRSIDYGSIILASSDPLTASYLAEEYSSTLEKHLKPIGTISLVKVDDDLYYLDSQSNLLSVPLSSPKIQFYILTACGKPSDALSCLQSFPEERLIDSAQFLCENNYAKYAVSIEKLCIFYKLKICIAHHLHELSLTLLPPLIEEKVNQMNSDFDLDFGDHDLMEIINSLLSTCSCSEVKEQILLLATQIDDSKYEELAVHYHSVYGGKKNTKLQQLYEKLKSIDKYHIAIFCSLLLGDEAHFNTTLKEGNTPEHRVYSSRKGYEITEGSLDCYLNSL